MNIISGLLQYLQSNPILGNNGIAGIKQAYDQTAVAKALQAKQQAQSNLNQQRDIALEQYGGVYDPQAHPFSENIKNLINDPKNLIAYQSNNIPNLGIKNIPPDLVRYAGDRRVEAMSGMMMGGVQPISKGVNALAEAADVMSGAMPAKSLTHKLSSTEMVMEAAKNQLTPTELQSVAKNGYTKSILKKIIQRAMAQSDSEMAQIDKMKVTHLTPPPANLETPNAIKYIKGEAGKFAGSKRI